MDIIASDKKNQTNTVAQLWPMYRAFVGVGAVCGFLIVMAFMLTLPSIQQNQAAYFQQAIFQVLPGASYKKAYVAESNAIGEIIKFVSVDKNQSSNVVYAAYSAHDALIGIAIEASGMGYQDTIRVLYGFDPASQRIVGMKVLSSKETPGLGDKIQNDIEFIANFKSLDVSLSDDSAALKNSLQLVKHGQKTQGWQVDGITGATISSRALTNILIGSTQKWIPIIHRHLATFSEGGSHGVSQ